MMPTGSRYSGIAAEVKAEVNKATQNKELNADQLRAITIITESAKGPGKRPWNDDAIERVKIDPDYAAAIVKADNEAIFCMIM